jgi:hypothetical protein
MKITNKIESPNKTAQILGIIMVIFSKLNTGATYSHKSLLVLHL